MNNTARNSRILTTLVLACLTLNAMAKEIPAQVPDPDGKPGDATRPLKVYILVGQSNMQGQAKVETFDYIGDDPATAPLLKEMRGPDGKPRVCEKVWISYFTGSKDNNGEGFGKLTAGYGSRSNPAEDGGKIGPEFTFGITMEKATDGPILIIKTAWGGKSLHTDFRPPSAGPYEFSEAQLEGLEKQGKDIAEAKADKAEKTGHYYRLMTGHVKKVLADIKRVYPHYDPKQGHEIAGFVWFQGWNDMCDSGTYPNRSEPDGYAKYSEWMADFIRDVRKDLNAPKMPFVIGVMGVDGDKATGGLAHIRQAMAAPASMPEFKGNVAALQTAPYWDQPLANIHLKQGMVGKVGYYLRKGNVSGRVVSSSYPTAYLLRRQYWDTPIEDRKMTKEQQQAYLKEYRAKLITPEEEALWQRGASNGGYHYLGSAKTMALIGKGFAEALVEMMDK
ncbi:MAG TPA: sialate O-acetylesterase [Phycisphaerae bacterium]|nr:sialate O-acetylesterase [Phycisphaerae bacterium]